MIKFQHTMEWCTRQIRLSENADAIIHSAAGQRIHSPSTYLITQHLLGHFVVVNHQDTPLFCLRCYNRRCHVVVRGVWHDITIGVGRKFAIAHHRRLVAFLRRWIHFQRDCESERGAYFFFALDAYGAPHEFHLFQSTNLSLFSPKIVIKKVIETATTEACYRY